MGRERRTLRGVELQADRVADLAHRPVAELRRRDVAIALLSVPTADALASLPSIRRGMLAAGNPLSAPFWDSAEAILAKISGHEATFGDVHGWLEATGTEPTGIIGLHVWAEATARSPLQEEMHARLVSYLEERLAAGEIDPDRMAVGDEAARHEYVVLQEQWMTTPLPDGRVPMTVLLDEQDEAFLADWAAADAEARTALRSVIETAGPRPLPAAELRAAAAKLRTDIARPGWPGQMLVSFSGRTAAALPADDAELWVTLAASVASPQGDPLSEEDKEFARAMEWADDADLEFGGTPGEDAGDEPDELSAAISAVCALDHFDWLAVMSALIGGGPGTPASAADLARYVRDFDPDEIAGDDEAETEDGAENLAAYPVRLLPEAAGDTGDIDEADDVVYRDELDFADDEPDLEPADFDEYDDFDELSIEGLFLHVTAMWSVLGAIDEDDRLTPLGWWGLPEAMLRAWSELAGVGRPVVGRAGRLVLKVVVRLRPDLLELLVHRAQQEKERDAERRHDEEAKQTRLHVTDRGGRVGASRQYGGEEGQRVTLSQIPAKRSSSGSSVSTSDLAR